jgi:hypothetical protein
LINPIDFSPLYQAEVMSRAKAAEAASEENPAA